MTTEQIILAYRPKGIPTSGDFKIERVELGEIQVGEVLLQPLYYSVDPYMRGRMSDAKSYVPPFEIGKPIVGGVVAKVLKSKADSLNEGDIVSGMLPWSELSITSVKGLQKIDTSVVSATYYLSILGMTGLAAYFGLLDIGKPEVGETLVVSGAAGAVGIVVGQIGKILGCRVIGIAGSDEKVELLKEKFGFDDAINYKTTSDMRKAIAKACPQGVDIYFDNVGGEISDAVISNINFHARIPLCGQISLYNSTEVPMGPRLQPLLLTKSALMQGFIVGNFQSRFPQGIEQLSQWLKNGMLTYTETITPGFNQLPAALIGLFKGENTGKMIVEA
jgi:NADPH-dependent curcumin reductase CurA